MQNNYTFINVISVTDVSTGHDLLKVGVVEEDRKFLKEEEEHFPYVIAY